MSENIVVSRVIPVKPERIYRAWLSGPEHGKMTGSTATYDSESNAFTAWDGYISGKTLEQVPHSRIVQSWRTTEFPPSAPDSRLVVSLEPLPEGTKLTLEHTKLPDGQGPSYETGWKDHYFEPMNDYFSSPVETLREMGEALEHAGEDALEAVGKASQSARRQALKAVKSVKKARKKAVAQAKKLGKRVRALVQRKKKPAKKVAPKKKAKAKRKQRR